MLTALTLRNFTVFRDVTCRFVPGLNVLVGDNGAGKTHVLKAAYTVMAVSSRGERESGSAGPSKAYLEKAYARKLRAVFQPDSIGRLVRRQQGRNRAEIQAVFKRRSLNCGFALDTASQTDVEVTQCPAQWDKQPPVYLPTRELLSIYPGFVSLYETAEIPFEETWRDTCLLLGAPVKKGVRLNSIRQLLDSIETQLGGQVVLDNGRFYLNLPSGRMEAHLVAEGLRKLAMIARLVATGNLAGTGTLFWDEPEANLNPRLLKAMARTILELAASGVQVLIATHSLFLLREFDILLKSGLYASLTHWFVGLQFSPDGVVAEQGDMVDDIGKIDALDEELNQTDRFLEVEVG